MIADVIILILIAGYSCFLIYRGYKNRKKGKTTGCGGSCGSCSCGFCSGNGGKISDDCRTEAFRRDK